MSTLRIIVANIIAKADKVELMKTELQKLINPTRTEKGCVNYDLHQVNQISVTLIWFSGCPNYFNQTQIIKQSSTDQTQQGEWSG